MSPTLSNALRLGRAPTSPTGVSGRSRVGTPVLCLALGLGLGLGACRGDGAESPPPVASTETPGDVPRVVNRAEPPRLDLRASTDFVLGGRDDDPAQAFYEVSEATVATTPSGEIAVLDRPNHRVVVFGDDGSLVRTLGREGEGPGELSRPFTLVALDGGRLAVWDLGRGGLVAFGPEGDPADPPPVPDELARRPVGSDGAALVVRRSEGGMYRLHRIDADGRAALVDSAVRLPGSDITLESCGLAFGGMEPLFAPELEWSGAGGYLAVVDSADYRVDLFRAGEPLRTVVRTVDPPRATESLALEELGEGMRIGVPDGERVCDPEEVVEARGFAEVVPVIDQVRVWPDGRLWVRRWSEGTDEGPVDVFDPDGTLVGTLPEGTPLPVGYLPDGRVLWVETDAYDVERLHVGRLEAGRGG